MGKTRQIIAFITALVLFVGISWTAAWLLMPVRTTYGGTWDFYLQEEEGSVDVLFFGSSLSYCDVIPAVIWEETGLHSYVLAGPEQTVPIMYHYIREACQSQKPQLIAAEVTNVFYRPYQHYTKANISYMPFGVNRFAATFAAAEQEERFGLLFPLFNYHYRWTDVEREEIQAHLSPGDDLTAGYTLLTKSCEAPTDTVLDYSSDTENYRRNVDYLGKLKSFCDKEGIELLLYITPSAGKIPEEALYALRSDLQTMGIILQDYNEELDALALDNDLDWYDPLHFNLRGAEKFSRFLAAELDEGYSLNAGSGDAALWQRRAEHINAALEELETSDMAE